MPADWSLPVNTTAYASVLADLAAKDVDAGTLCDGGDPSNMPTGMKKFNTGTNRFQRWNGAAWVDLVLDIGGGGTGASSAATARTNLGLGDMATQSSSAINISGGTIAGATLRGQDIVSGLIAQARLGSGSTGLGQNFLADDQTYKPATAPPVGLICSWPAAVAPSGWLICDGSAISRTTYSTLFALIGTTYGAGDGSTTFNIPDLRQKFILGKAAAGTGNTLGATGGAIDHTHSCAAHTHSISSDGSHSHTVASHTHTGPSHSHGGATGGTDVNHQHTFNVDSGGVVSEGNYIVQDWGSGAIDTIAFLHHHNVNGTTAGSTTSLAHTHTIAADGTGATGAASPATDAQGAHSHGALTGSTTPGTGSTNNPPFMALNWIIKT